jgi:hypothetical protein
MKRDIAFVGFFLLSAAAAAVQQVKHGLDLVDATAYGIGFGVVSFFIAFALIGGAWLLIKPRVAEVDRSTLINRSLFGGSNEERPTRL